MEQLIDPPTRLSASTKTLAVGLLFVSLAVVTVTPAVDALHPVEEPMLLGEEARLEAETARESNLSDGTWMRRIERKLRLRSRVRHTIAPYWSAFLLRYLGDAPHDLIIGRDDWLFLRERVRREDQLMARAPAVTARLSTALQRRVAASGSQLVFAPVPRKAVVCAEMLPPGVDARPELEDAVIAEFDRYGVESIDIRAAFDHLAVEDRYLRLDSHWTQVAARAFVDAIVERYPHIVGDTYESSIVERDAEAIAGLLPFAAIPLDHPAKDLVRTDRETLFQLEPPTLRKLIHGGATDVDVAMVGSSFTDHFDVAHLLAHRIREAVYDGGRAGTRFGDPLGQMLATFRGEALAPLVVYEFPVHQIFKIADDPAWAASALGGVFQYWPPPAVTPLEDGAFRKVLWPEERRVEHPAVLYPPGSLLSTGDGAMQLVISVTSDESTIWRVCTEHTQVDHYVEPGDSRWVTPVFDRGEPSSGTTIVAGNAAAVGAELTVTPAVDADLVRATPLTGERTADGWSFLRDELPIRRHDLLILRWTGQAEQLEIECVGVDQAGAMQSVARVFGSPLGRIAVFGLSPLDGCDLDAVRVRARDDGDFANPTAVIAPLASR